MKKLFFMLLTSLTLGACTFTSSTHESANKESLTNTLKVAILADNKDHSCGMTLQDGHIADTTSYKGSTYGFCSSACKEEFLKSPEAMLQKNK
jgi:YHS domain-containing protein